MTRKIDIEAWRLVVEHWRSQGRDLRHLEVPPELASQLGVPMELTKERRHEEPETEPTEDEDDMAKKNQKKTAPKKSKDKTKAKPKTRDAATKASSEPLVVDKSVAKAIAISQALDEPMPVPTEESAPPQAEQQEETPAAAVENTDKPKWKKRSTFDGNDCGLSGCTKMADGYVPGVRSTKEGARDLKGLWVGPACNGHAVQLHPQWQRAMTLAELASQRNGASDLANILDIEVGEVHKRLAAANIDEKGQPLTQMEPHHTGRPFPGQGAEVVHQAVVMPQPQQSQGATMIMVQREEQHTVAVIVPYDQLAATRAEMAQSSAALAQYVIRDQGAMDYASTYLKRVKGIWKHLDEARKAIARPFNEVVDAIQAHFKPALTDLETVEATLKKAIDEGMQWATAQAQQSFQAAQQALAVGDAQGVALATQQAMGADMTLPKGISTRPKFRFEIVAPQQVDAAFWSIDEKKLQAHLDSLNPEQVQQLLANGYTPLAGCRVWQENVISSRAA